MLTGQAKTDYMREYMRKRRSNRKGLTEESKSVRPKAEVVRPVIAKPMQATGWIEVQSEPLDSGRWLWSTEDTLTYPIWYT